MTTPAGPVTLRLLDRDYCYGLGPVEIRVEHIDRANPVRYDGDTFYRVEGMQIGHNGAEVGRLEVLVRSRCLPRT